MKRYVGFGEPINIVKQAAYHFTYFLRLELSPTFVATNWYVSVDYQQETIAFVHANYPDWSIVGGTIETKGSKTSKLAEIPSLKLISQNLSYATELERIVWYRVVDYMLKHLSPLRMCK